MPKIAETQVRKNAETNESEVWCRVILERNTDVLGPITLYTPAEIELIKENAVNDFWNSLKALVVNR